MATTKKKTKLSWEIFGCDENPKEFLKRFEKDSHAIKDPEQQKIFKLEVMSSPEYRAAVGGEKGPYEGLIQIMPEQIGFFDASSPMHFTKFVSSTFSERSLLSIDLANFNDFYQRNHLPGAP